MHFFAAFLSPWILALVLTSCQSQLAKDLDTFCDIVLKTHGNEDLNPPDRAEAIESTIAETIKGQEFGQLFEQAWKKPRKERHEFLRTKAKEKGLSYWRCTAIDHFYSELAGWEFDQRNPPINLHTDAKTKTKSQPQQQLKRAKRRRKSGASTR